MKVWAERYDGTSGHGYDCWKSPFETYGQAIINKSNDVLRRCVLGRVIPKGKMTSMKGRTVTFADGTEIHNIDLIYFATGYAMYFPMLKDLNREHQCSSTLYKFCMDNVDESIGFVGFCRPIRGSFPSLSETCSRLLAYSWGGKVPIPPPHERERITRFDRLGRDNFFTGFDQWGYTKKCPSTGGVYRANARSAGLVDLFYFTDEIAKILGIMPNYWRVLTECGFYKYYLAMLAPYHQGQFMLNDPSKREYYFSRCEYFLTRFPVFIPIIFSLFQGFYHNWKAYLRNRFYWTIGYLFVRKPHPAAIHVYEYRAAINRAKCALSYPDALKEEWPPADGLPRCKNADEFCTNLTKIALQGTMDCHDSSCSTSSCGTSACGTPAASSCGTSACGTGPASTATCSINVAVGKVCPICGVKTSDCNCRSNADAANSAEAQKFKGICKECGCFASKCICEQTRPSTPSKANKTESTPTKKRSSTPSKSKIERAASPSPVKVTTPAATARRRRN